MCLLKSVKALTPSNIFRGTPSFHVMDDVVCHAVIASACSGLWPALDYDVLLLHAVGHDCGQKIYPSVHHPDDNIPGFFCYWTIYLL